MSVSSRSALLPMEIIFASPTPLPLSQSRSAAHSAPDCDTTEMEPRSGIRAAKEAFKWWAVLITPRQLGPSIRAPLAVHISSRTRSRAAPSPPTSLNPAVITTTARAPLSSELRTAASTAETGVAITLSSMVPS